MNIKKKIQFEYLPILNQDDAKESLLEIKELTSKVCLSPSKRWGSISNLREIAELATALSEYVSVDESGKSIEKLKNSKEE